jgi:vacuolar fusion protein MON1
LVAILQKLIDDNIVAGISKSIHTGSVRYSVSELGIPGLRHFVYKSRLHVQVTVPVYEDPYDALEDRRRSVLGCRAWAGLSWLLAIGW